MKNSIKIPIWFWVATAVVLVGSLISVTARHRIEARNKAVAPAIEFSVIADAASTSGQTTEQALLTLRAQGLRAVVLPESTINDWISDGHMEMLVSPTRRTFVTSPEWAKVAVDGLNRRNIAFGQASGTDGRVRIELDLGTSFDVLRSVSLGLDSDAAKLIRDADLLLIARHSNVPAVQPDYIRQILTDSAQKGAKGFLPQGDAVLGQRKYLKDTMATLKELGMFYASPEFARLAGETNMVIGGPDNTVRLHSIQAAEVDRMSPREVVERFARAYAERNQRVLLIRPFETEGQTALDALASSVTQINRAIEKEGGKVGFPRPWSSPDVSRLVLIAIGIGIVGVAFFVLSTLLPNPIGQVAGTVVFLGVLALGVLRNDWTYLATLGATSFPIAAYLVQREIEHKAVVFQWFLMFGLCLVGGLLVAGLLNSPMFYVKGDTFFAVKVAHFAPVLLVAGLCINRVFDIKSVSKLPITWGAMGLLIIILGGLFFMVARTGNDSPGAVSGFELQIRSMLENFFSVRPRTKEFLLGYPALMISLMLLHNAPKLSDAGRDRATAIGALLLPVGMIALTSVINTMCHLHTPVMVGLIRIIIGMIVGGLVGWVAWMMLKPILLQNKVSS